MRRNQTERSQPVGHLWTCGIGDPNRTWKPQNGTCVRFVSLQTAQKQGHQLTKAITPSLAQVNSNPSLERVCHIAQSCLVPVLKFHLGESVCFRQLPAANMKDADVTLSDVCTNVQKQARAHIRTHRRTHTHRNIQRHKNTDTRRHRHTDTRTHTHRHTYIHAQARPHNKHDTQRESQKKHPTSSALWLLPPKIRIAEDKDAV